MSIREKLMNNYLASFAWYGYKFLKYRIPMLAASVYPVNKNKTVFMSFNGMNYADNPRAVSEKLHEMYPTHEIVWGMSSLEHAGKVVPEYVRVVRYGSFAWYREIATSGAWVFNVLMPHGILKRKGQKYIQTWHGDRGFKKIVFDAAESNDNYRKRNYFRKIVEPELCDLGNAGSDYGIMQYRSAFHYTGTLIENGIPRNDILVNLTPSKRMSLKNKVGIPVDTNVLMYAPTFRDHLYSKVQTSGGLDILEVLDALEKKTGENWVCIQRGHAGMELETKAEYGSRVIDMSGYEDIADLLCITDLLITDYSSMHGDLALTGHGTIFYQEDLEEYTAKDRQLYFEMTDTPFWVAHDQKEMLAMIERYDEEAMKQNAKDILDFYNTFETGHSSESVVKYIISGEIAPTSEHTGNKFMKS